MTIIAAISENMVIGKDNKMPWKVAADLADFRKETSGNTVIMGRKTFESIGYKLKNRTVIVLSKKKNYNLPNTLVAHSREEALKLAPKDKKIYIAGGEKIYKLFLDIADEIRLTKIHQEFEGDTFFPKFSKKEWKTFKEGKMKKDIKSGIQYSLTIYHRNEN